MMHNIHIYRRSPTVEQCKSNNFMLLAVSCVLHSNKQGHGDIYIPQPTALPGHVSNTHKHQCTLHNNPQSIYDA